MGFAEEGREFLGKITISKIPNSKDQDKDALPKTTSSEWAWSFEYNKSSGSERDDATLVYLVGNLAKLLGKKNGGRGSIHDSRYLFRINSMI